MDQFLPSLLEWGPWLWKAIVAAFALLVLAAVLAIRYAIARTAGNRAGRAIRIDHGAVRGVLRGKPGPLAATIKVEVNNLGGQPTAGAASWRADEVWLETADKKISLVGPLRVIAGARFAARRGKLPPLPAGGEAALHEQLSWSKAPLHTAMIESLGDGDEIAVCGLPQPHAGKGETTGREADIAWTLEGTDDAPLELAGTRPRAPRLPLGIVRSVVVLALAAGAGQFVIHHLGKDWARECATIRFDIYNPPDRGLDEPLVLTNGHPCILAASVENDRERSLDTVQELLERHPYRDAATVTALIELARETRPCRARVDALFYNSQFEAALDEAWLCGDHRIEHESLVALGRFEEALAVSVPDDGNIYTQLPAISTLIAAKRWTEAADRVDARAAALDQHRDEVGLRCTAELMRHHGGDAAALGRLKTIAAAEEADVDPAISRDVFSTPCTGILAQIDPATHKRWTGRMWDTGGGPTSLLRDAAGHAPLIPHDHFADILINPENSHELARVWLSVESTSKGMELSRLRQRAARATFDNDPIAAKRFATEAVALAAALTDEERRTDVMHGFRDVPVIEDAVALYTDEITKQSVPEVTNELYMSRYGRLYVRSQLPLDNLRVVHDPQVQDAFVAVKRTGSGKDALRHLRPRGVYWTDPDLLAVLPHIKTHRASIARELPFWPPPTVRDPFAAAARAMIRRELFEALGDTADAAKWETVYRRHAQVFEDRDRLVALILAR